MACWLARYSRCHCQAKNGLENDTPKKCMAQRNPIAIECRLRQSIAHHHTIIYDPKGKSIKSLWTSCTEDIVLLREIEEFSNGRNA